MPSTAYMHYWKMALSLNYKLKDVNTTGGDLQDNGLHVQVAVATF